MVTTVKLDQDAQKLLDQAKALNLPPMAMLSPLEARARVRAMRVALKQPVLEIAEVRDLSARGRHGDIPLRLYRGEALKPGLSQPCLIYFHGGGWLFGDLDTHDLLCRHIAVAARCTVVAVDYRLAPENKFPIPFEDSYDATIWIADNSTNLRVDRRRLAVGGDSAGGTLAAAVSLLARDEKIAPPLSAQILIHPVTDLGFVHDSHVRVGQGFNLTAADMHWFRGHYLRSLQDVEDWRASPLRAKDFSGLPPALVITAGADPLQDEGKDYALRLQKGGAMVTHKHFAGQMHIFIVFLGIIKAADEAVGDVAKHLRTVWDAM